MHRLCILGAGWLIGATAACSAAAVAGAANPQVAGLQVALQKQGLYAGPIDAVQGPGTLGALVRFQRRAHLLPDGLAGTKTRAALGRWGRPLFGRRVIRRGLAGWDVAVLQYLLRERRLAVGRIDGIFGPRTEAAVVRFQRRRHMAPDGIVGLRTRTALCPLPVCLSRRAPKPRPLHHVVRAGENLTEIASRYRVSLSALARLNGLDLRRVLLVGTVLRIPSPPVRARSSRVEEVLRAIDRWSRFYGVSAHLVRAVAWMESGYHAAIVSATGAWGVMQIHPDTWAWAEAVLIGHRVPRTVEGNVRIGVAYLRNLLNRFHGDRPSALAAYYQGPRSLYERGILPASRLYIEDVLALEERL